MGKLTQQPTTVSIAFALFPASFNPPCATVLFFQGASKGAPNHQRVWILRILLTELLLRFATRMCQRAQPVHVGNLLVLLVLKIQVTALHSSTTSRLLWGTWMCQPPGFPKETRRLLQLWPCKLLALFLLFGVFHSTIWGVSLPLNSHRVIANLV